MPQDDEIVMQCKFWGSKLPKGEKRIGFDERARTCTVDYVDDEVKEDISTDADCERRCEDVTIPEENEPEPDTEEGDDYEPIDYLKDCISGCNSEVEHYSRGMIRYKPSGEIVEGSIPIKYTKAYAEDKYGESHWDSDAMAEISRRLFDIGCYGLQDRHAGENHFPEISWIHPHEFVSATAGSEPEGEEPTALWVHITNNGKSGQCMIDKALKILRGEDEPPLVSPPQQVRDVDGRPMQWDGKTEIEVSWSSVPYTQVQTRDPAGHPICQSCAKGLHPHGGSRYSDCKVILTDATGKQTGQCCCMWRATAQSI